MANSHAGLKTPRFIQVSIKTTHCVCFIFIFFTGLEQHFSIGEMQLENRLHGCIDWADFFYGHFFKYVSVEQITL